MIIDNEILRCSMLLQFKFKNFKSFAEESVLDMTATNIKEHMNSLIDRNGNKILPVAAIFGANASGKSNIFSAFYSMVRDVNSIYNKGESHFLVTPYYFNEVKNYPTEYEVSICIGDKECRYGFARDQTKIYEEWLFSRKFAKNTKASERMVFYRSNNKIHVGKLNMKEKQELNYLSSMIDENELLLTAMGRRSKSEYSAVYEWFNSTPLFQDYSNDYDENRSAKLTAKLLYKSREILSDVENLLKKFDDSIRRIQIIPIVGQDLNEEYHVYCYHYNDNGEEIPLPIESESSGTKKIFALAALLFISLSNGLVLWVDELDTKMHPLILRYIIRLFCDRKTNIGNGQLIFSSHNLVCLDSSDLRRDEIWFVEKKDQKSKLYSLYDFKEDEVSIRSDLSFGKHYLAGRFGAIPFQNEED